MLRQLERVAPPDADRPLAPPPRLPLPARAAPAAAPLPPAAGRALEPEPVRAGEWLTRDAYAEAGAVLKAGGGGGAAAVCAVPP